MDISMLAPRLSLQELRRATSQEEYTRLAAVLFRRGSLRFAGMLLRHSADIFIVAEASKFRVP
jgi:hypothetical protein